MEKSDWYIGKWKNQMIKYFISVSTFHESVSHNSCCGGRIDLPEYFMVYTKKRKEKKNNMEFTWPSEGKLSKFIANK